MSLFKTGFFTSISTFIKIVSGFIINKAIAIWVGPSGIALVGQFQNFISIIMLLANGGINNGVVKYVSEYKENSQKLTHILSSSFFLSSICSIILAFFIILFQHQLSLFFLKSSEYQSVFVVFGATLILFSLNTFLFSVLNGFKEIKKFIAVNISTSIISLILTIVLVYYYKMYGVILGLTITSSVVFFITLFFTVKCKWFRLQNFVKGYDKETVKKLLNYSAMSLTTALTIPIAQLIVRNYIIHNISIDAAGFWQGIFKVSDAYLLLITSSLTVYLLPRYSEINDKFLLKKEIFKSYKLIMPLVIFMALSIFAFREYIVKLLFDVKFLPMANLFAFQLVGDVFRVAFLLLSLLIVAKAMTGWYIFFEIFLSILYVGLSIIFINDYGLVGATYAFALSMSICFFLCIMVVKNYFFSNNSI